MKKNEVLSFAGKWMELENIILSELSQIQKTKKSYVLPHMQSLNLGQMQQCGWTWITRKEESTYGRYRNRLKTQNMKAFDVPTPEELIQKP
jgi:23S rRNA maturation mini-RNase III